MGDALADMDNKNAQFAGSIPSAYDRYLGPMFFQPYAEDLAARLKVDDNGRVLEIACGTGILTAALRNKLPAGITIIATDLNEAMFRYAEQKPGHANGVEWRQADACSLPF